MAPGKPDYLKTSLQERRVLIEMKQKQEQLKQIKIDLDKDCISPRKILCDVYEKGNANDIWIDKDLKPEYRNNLRIRMWRVKDQGTRSPRKYSPCTENDYQTEPSG